MAYCMNKETKEVSYFDCTSLTQNDKIFKCRCLLKIKKLDKSHNDNNQPHQDMYSRIKRNTR